MSDESKAYVYRKVPTPKQKVVTTSQAKMLYKKGWTDNPSKFAITPTGFIINVVSLSWSTLKIFWLNHWKWIIGVMINISGLYFAWLELKK